MKCSLDISNFLEEISSLSQSVIFLFFFALIAEEGFLISPCYSLELCIQMLAAAAAAKSLQSCPTPWDPIDGSQPGSPIPGILQARTLEWCAISFSNAGKWKVKVKLLSRVQLFATPWTAAYQAPLSMGFSRQEYWSGVPLPSPRGEGRVAYKIWFRKQIKKIRFFLMESSWGRRKEQIALPGWGPDPVTKKEWPSQDTRNAQKLLSFVDLQCWGGRV